jgi:hypothetical protein
VQGELAQLVALAAHGSAYLTGPAEAQAPELYPSSTVFQFTNAVEFQRATWRFGVLPTRTIVAQACAPWFADLRQRGATALRLARGRSVPRNRQLPPYIEAGFSNGLDAGVVAHFSNGKRELWSGRSAVTMDQHPERRIWSVQFRGRSTRARLTEGPPPDAAQRRLDAALQGAIALVAGRMHFNDWERIFRGALAQLTASAPEVPYYVDLLPSKGYGLQSRRLLAAASGAWVFGGMGTWNDVAIDDVESYRAVTAELFEGVMDAVLAATNSHGKEARNRES